MRCPLPEFVVRDDCRWAVLFVVTGWLSFFARGSSVAQTDPPAGYYTTATGTGATLKSQLHNLIDNHTVRSNNAARSLLQLTDAVPGRPGYMLLAYDEFELNVAAINPNGSIPGWDSANTWNREHTWPASQQGTSGPGYSDLHQLRPTFTQTNSNRGNLSFGGAYGSRGGQTGTVNDGGTVWYPGDADAGRIARQQFYMAVRYDGSDAGTGNLELTESSSPGSNQLGKLSRMIQWHYAAPVDDFELQRNQRVYGLQNNRNPFIDRPEYVWSVFVDQQNDSRLFFGGNEPADGASATGVGLQPVFVGADLDPNERTIARLRRGGVDPTYFLVTASDRAITDYAGKRVPFVASGFDPLFSFEVGHDTDTLVAGFHTGQIIVNNLDVTTEGGSGRGANDGDDVLTVGRYVYHHGTASFDASSLVRSQTLDFGVLARSDVTATFSFLVHNLPHTSGGLTGAIDVRETTPDDLAAPFRLPYDYSEIEAGEANVVDLFVDLDRTGSFDTTWTLDVMERDLPGSIEQPDLELRVIATIALAGDANLSGSVEQGDLDAVLGNWGVGSQAQWRDGDFNRDGAVNQSDLDAVLAGWGAAATPDLRGFSVPEPAWFGLILSAGVMGWRRRGLVA